MQIKGYKYDQADFSVINITESNKEITLDVQLKLNSASKGSSVNILGDVKDSNGNSIEGALVKIMDETLKNLGNTVTMNNGKYLITNVPIKGSYSMEVFSKGRKLNTISNIVIKEGEYKEINFILEDDPKTSLGVVSGKVVDSNKNIISGAIVFLYNVVNGNKNLMAITYTDKYGQFILAELIAGTYDLEFSALGYMSNTENITIKIGEIFDLLKELEINPVFSQGIISGIISDENNNPINNADVILYNIDNLNDIKPIGFTITNSLGMYTFINVPHGNYMVKSKQLEIIDLPDNSIKPPTLSTGEINLTDLPQTYMYTSINGLISGAAQLDESNGFVGFIGGVNNGVLNTIVSLDNDGIYNLVFKYIGADMNRPLKIDINSVNTGTIYTLPKTNGWTKLDAKTFTVPIILNKGSNSIKFYGDGYNYSPTLGGINLILISQKTKPQLQSNINAQVYNITMANFYNNMKLDILNNIANMMGGPLDGAVTFNVEVLKEGIYNLEIQYLVGDSNRKMVIDINGINTGKIYCIPKTMSWNMTSLKTFTVPIGLIKGVNTIKFHGDGINYGPTIGDIKISLVSEIKVSTWPVGTYNILDGAISGGASISSQEQLVLGIGGEANGSILFTLSVQQTGMYTMSLKYRNIDNLVRNLNVDINGINTGTIYKVSPSTSNGGIFTISIVLKSGGNSIRFYGDGLNKAPDLGLFTLKLQSIIDKTMYIYSVADGKIEGGAQIESKTNFVGFLGGTTNGSSLVTIDVGYAGVYNLAIDYIAGDNNRPLKIDINGISVGMPYILEKTNSWNLSDVKVFKTLINLNSGINTIKFYGDGINYAPSLGLIKINLTNLNSAIISPPTTTTITNYSMEASSGTLSNGAKIESTINFAGWLGGPTDGSTTLNFDIATSGKYNLLVQYVGADTSRPLKIDVNGINTGTVYITEKTTGWTLNDSKIFTTTLDLKSGKNSIKFHGNGIDYAPSLGTVKLTVITTNYSANASEGILSNGAKVESTINFAGWLGGPIDGSTTLTFDITTSGKYNLSVQYVGADTNRPLKIDVNGVNTGTIYSTEKTNGWAVEDSKLLVVMVQLNSGVNTIKFHGNGVDYAPSIGKVNLTLS